MRQDEIISEITEAFAGLHIPLRVLDDDFPAEELPAGHPGYGKGQPPEEFNEVDFIVRNIQGKSWRDLDAREVQWMILLTTIEAIRYYLPAFMIYNIRHQFEIETLDIYLQAPRFGVSMRHRLFEVLSRQQRITVARYLALAPDRYTDIDILFWMSD